MSLLLPALQEAHRLLGQFLADPEAQTQLDGFVQDLTQAFQKGNRVLAAGNGGSLADAMHFCEEFTGRFRADRAPLPALSLADPTHLTCVANDYGFEFVFSRMVEAFGQPGDILLLLSTSGNSANLLRAAEAARARQVHVVGFLGRGGGALAPLCDRVILAPGTTSDRIQEIHMLCLHAVIEAVEKNLFPAQV